MSEESESTKPDDLQSLVRELVESTNRTMQSHAAGLKRHEQGLVTHDKDLLEALKSLKVHADSIQVLRKDLLGLGDLVNQQTHVLTALQGTMLRVLSSLGMMPEEPPPSPTAPN